MYFADDHNGRMSVRVFSKGKSIENKVHSNEILIFDTIFRRHLQKITRIDKFQLKHNKKTDHVQTLHWTPVEILF